MSRKEKKVFTTLDYTQHFLILASTITGCISIYTFTSLLGIPIECTSSAVELKIWAILSSNSTPFQIIVIPAYSLFDFLSDLSPSFLFGPPPPPPIVLQVFQRNGLFYLRNSKHVLKKYNNFKELIKFNKCFSLFIKQYCLK